MSEESGDGESAGAVPVPKYWACQHICVDNVGSKIASKAEIFSPQFFCRTDPHPAFFRMELQFGLRKNNYLTVWVRSMSRDIAKTSLNWLVLENNSSGKKIAEVRLSGRSMIAKGESRGRIEFLEFPLLENEQVNWHVIIELQYEGSSSDPKPITSSSDPSLVEDFLKLFESGQFADFTFIVQGEKVIAHKNILLARCTYFEGMFLSDMKENQTNEVEVTDVKPEVFKELLKFLYSGQPPEYSDNEIRELFAAADKYGVERLKMHCESLLCSNLTTENVIEVLFLAEEHVSSAMKESAMTFVKANCSYLTEEKQNKLQTRPKLLFELFKSNYASE